MTGKCGAAINRALLDMIGFLSGGFLSGRFRAQDGAVLCLHSIGPAPPPRQGFEPLADLTHSAAFLEALVVEFRKRGFDFLSLEDALPSHREHRGGRRFLALTFDDGYADNFTRAYPVLRRHGVPFTLFVTTGFVDRTVPMWWLLFAGLIRERDALVLPGRILPARNAAEKTAAFAAARDLVMGMRPEHYPGFFGRLREANPSPAAYEAADSAPLDWPRIREMAADGLVTLGCHSVSHAAMSLLDRKGCEAEILPARDRIAEMTGIVPRFFAYPYGSRTEVGTLPPAIVAESGFAAGFTTSAGILGAAGMDRYQIPRIAIGAWNFRVIGAHASGLPVFLHEKLASFRRNKPGEIR